MSGMAQREVEALPLHSIVAVAGWPDLLYVRRESGWTALDLKQGVFRGAGILTTRGMFGGDTYRNPGVTLIHSAPALEGEKTP